MKKNLLFLMVGLMASLWSCQQDDSVVLKEAAEPESVYSHVYSTEKGELVEMTINGQDLVFEKFGEKYVLEGDIVLTLDDIEQLKKEGASNLKGAGITVGSKKWPKNAVYYVIDPGMSNTKKQNVLAAINHWNNNTSLCLIARNNQSNYITIKSSGDNSSWSSGVGMKGGEQTIALADWANAGTVIHEIGHAVGLWHEQSREDRDNHCIVHFENIIDGKEHNFNKYNAKNGDDFEAFDFGSIMMYSSKAFSKNRKPTITKKDGTGYSTNRNKLATSDIKTIKAMYPAKGVYFYIVNKGKNIKLRPKNDKDNCEMIQTPATNMGDWVKWEKVVNAGHFHLKNKNTGKVFRPVDNKAGANMQQKANLSSWTQWRMKASLDGYSHFFNRQTGLKFRICSTDGTDNTIEQTGAESTADWTKWKMVPGN